jgi:solute carrier family 39 (zinc transporter), member 1/2/3
MAPSFSHLQQKKLIAEFPFHLGELLMCLGFFFVALVDQVVHWLLHHYQDLQTNPSEMITAAVTRRSRRGIGSVADLIENDMENQKREHDDEHERQVATHQSGTTLSISNNRIVLAEPSCTPELPYHHHALPATASFSGLLMVLALSVHELFEGLAVGLENSSSNVMIMFISVFFHKVVISFCVGVERLVAKSGFCSMFFYVFSFAFASPLGIFLGIIISTSSSNQVASTEVLSVILQGKLLR